MTEEIEMLPEPEEFMDMGESAMDVIQDTLGEFIATADVHAVYAEPIEHGDTLIIPAAEVLCGMAFGMGSGSGSGPISQDAEGKTEDTGEGSGGGGGGGGRAFARPVAVVVADAEGVRVEPVVDVTKIALAALTAVGFMVGMVLRMSSPRHAFPEIEE